jgi:hypothetical protein
MHRQLIAFCAAAATALAIPAFAQTERAPVSSDKDVTLTGCVQKNKSGGYWLTNATMGDEHASASSSTSTTTATGTSGSATTTADNDIRTATNNHMWNLGTQKDVEKYVNQKIQVTGHAKNDTSGDQLKGTHGGEMQARDFDVKSIRLISPSCS